MRIELRHHPGCAHVENARRLLRDTLGELGLDEQVDEHEGDYASPTILVEGVDVMGMPDQPGPSCRLDVPTRERLEVALLSASGNSPSGPAGGF